MVKSTLSSHIHKNWTFPHFLAITIHSYPTDITLATTYARPNSHIPYSDLNKLFNNNHPTVLLADLNAKHHTYGHHSVNTHGRQLHALATQKRMIYLGPDFPTVYTSNGTGKPDLVFSNLPFSQLHHHISPGPISGSDHIPILMYVSQNPILIPSTPRFHFKSGDWEAFSSELENLPPLPDLSGTPAITIDHHIEKLHTEILAAAKKHIPAHPYQIRRSFHPSIKTRRLLVCYRRRFELNRRCYYRISSDLSTLRTHLIHSFNQDHIKHWENLIHQVEPHRSKNPSHFWQTIKRLRGNNKQGTIEFPDNNTTTSNPDDIVRIFRDTWEHIYHPNPPTSSQLIHTHLVNRKLGFLSHLTNPDTHIDFTRLDPNNPLTAPITHEDISDVFRSTPKKAPGASGITHHMVRHLPPNIINIFSHLFNASLASGYFPLTFKSSSVKFIPKKGKLHTDPFNFRPISLLEITGKSFEKIINQRLRAHLEDEDLLSPKQLGFRPYRSTQEALNIISTYLHINRHSPRTYKSAIITKDVQKAFDKVWHAGLMYKILHNFNLPSPLQRLLCNYLTNRRVTIKYQQATSQPFTLNAGVPQGSAIAPTLFNMYMQDAPDPLYSDSLIIIYADDITILSRARQLDHLTTKLSKELDRITRWEEKWRIKTNPAKSKVIFFGIKRSTPRKIYHQPTNHLSIIPRTSQTKILGINYDDKLTFKSMIKEKACIAAKTLAELQRFRTATSKTKKHLYKALIRPLITYSPLSILLATPKNQLQLQKIQNKAIKWMLNVRWDDFQTLPTLHERAGIPPLNIYLHHLLRKQINKLLDMPTHLTQLIKSLTPVSRPHLNLLANTTPEPPALLY